MKDRVCESFFVLWRGRCNSAVRLFLGLLPLLAGLCVAGRCQNTMVQSAPAARSRHQVDSDITVEGLMSYGNYKIFASGYDCKLYTAGVEYDRNSWGRFLGARLDYVAEVLPLVLLKEPTQADIWGNPQTTARQIVPGIGIAPIGFRMLWRSNKVIKPYLTAKGGMLGFDKKVLSSKATYQNFSMQSAIGVQVKMNQRWDLRLGLFSDFHFSDFFVVPVNPGLDVMNANLGLTYHLRSGER